AVGDSFSKRPVHRARIDSHETQGIVLKQLADAGHNGQILLEAARDALIGSVHAGISVAVVVTVIAVVLVSRVPRITLNTKSEPLVVGD
ncbi:hypothetical protein ACVBEF_13965, partial [Glaciimonas sp. GG7]